MGFDDARVIKLLLVNVVRGCVRVLHVHVVRCEVTVVLPWAICSCSPPSVEQQSANQMCLFDWLDVRSTEVKCVKSSLPSL